jgi:hypothetical protein
MKDTKRTNQQVTLVRDRLYINNELYVVPRTGVIPTDEDYENTTPIRSTRTEAAHHQTLPKASPNSEKPPSKRQRIQEHFIYLSISKHVHKFDTDLSLMSQ